jgi:cell division protein FtsZ
MPKQAKKKTSTQKNKNVKTTTTRRKRTPTPTTSNRPFVRIKVVGIGGGGGNAITRMKEGFMRGVDFIGVNTDAQDLEYCAAKQRIHIGRVITRGMGAGMDPELGKQAAEENKGEIAEALRDTDIVFLTAGFGGGTGTGATPVIAEVARENGILTVAVVTKPFAFEGAARMRIAEDGIAELRNKVDTLLVIPNDRIFNIIDNDTPVIKAFEKIDEILKSAVQGIAEMISSAGLINVDFADVRSIMASAGESVIGVGIAGGQGRAMKAVKEAITSPLLDRTIEGAGGVLFAVAGGKDLKMSEINESARAVTDTIDSNAKIIFGAYTDRKLKAGQIKVVLVATGFDRMASFSSGTANAASLDLFDPEVKRSLLDEKEKEEPASSAIDRDEAKEEKTIRSESDDRPTEEPRTNDEKEEDIWEIPAFLRRNKRK